MTRRLSFAWLVFKKRTRFSLYLIKGILCILLDREKECEGLTQRESDIMLSIIHSGTYECDYGTGIGFQYISVGRGIFNWYYTENSDGTL